MKLWLIQLFCWHEWRIFRPDIDYPEFDYKACWKCGKRELICI